MSAMELTPEIAERIRTIVVAAAGSATIICGRGGVIQAAADKGRIGQVHEGAARIVRGEVDEIAISQADVAQMKGVRLAGYNCLISYKGERIGSVAVAGEPSEVRAAARLAAHVVEVELSVLEQKLRIRQEVRVSLEHTSAAAEEILAGTEVHRQLADDLDAATRGLLERSRASLQSLRLISDLAQRANLLGLNAAVEAAHAGRQGAGFVVVADEIRKLADRTKSSATEITTALTEWQRSFEEVARSVAQSGIVAREQAEAIRAVTTAVQNIQTAVASLTD